MKKGWVFFLGIVTGFILTIVAALIIGISSYNDTYNDTNKPDITIAERQTEFTIATKFEVFQVLQNGALARCEERQYSISSFTGPVVYIITDGQNLFYDDEVIKIPKGKKAIQIGTYRYQTRQTEKVVPAIKFQ